MTYSEMNRLVFAFYGENFADFAKTVNDLPKKDLLDLLRFVVWVSLECEYADRQAQVELERKRKIVILAMNIKKKYPQRG